MLCILKIIIGNIRTHKNDASIAIRVDRSSVLGNPFHIDHESKRDLVCDQYEIYFNNKLNKGTDLAFIGELNRIYELYKTYDITLLCWCSPKRCHAETIKRYLERRYAYEYSQTVKL